MAFLAVGTRVRGLVDSLVLGYKAFEIAANHAFDDEDEQAKQ